MTPENISVNRDGFIACGTAWVKEGRIYVSASSGAGQAPAVIPAEGIDVVINGTKVSGKTPVNENDEITLIPWTSDKPGTFKIRIEPGGLAAVLELEVATTVSYAIEDCGPENELVLKSVKSEVRSCPFSLDELMRELGRQNITYGVKHSEIQDILVSAADGSYLIAEGAPPGKAVNGWVELTFKSEQKNGSVESKVDYRDLAEIPTVDPGQLLAVLHPAVQGTPGRTVTGDIILPEIPRAAEIKAGKGVELSSDGARAFSKIGGRPVAKKAGSSIFIDVEPVLHHRGDVDISTGNIRFKGDIVIYGDVKEGMTVQAAGKVNISGMVFEAGIATRGDITVARNITGSSLVAGGNNTFFTELSKILVSLQAGLTGIAKALPDMAKHPRLKGVQTGQIIQFLIDRKFGQIPSVVARLTRLTGQSSFFLPGDLERLIASVEQNLKGLNLLRIDSPASFHKILSEVEEAQIIIDGMAKDRANIIFGYAINSSFEASGDVHVVGRGCINTVIRAGGSVKVKGVFRGGEIAAQGDVSLNEAGSELGVRTLIKAGERGKIFIKKAHEGVQVLIGSQKSQINSLQYNFTAGRWAPGKP